MPPQLMEAFLNPGRCVLRRFLVGGLLLVASMLAGCDEQKLIEQFTTSEDQTFAKTAINLMRHKEYKSLEAEFDPKLKTKQLRPAISQMADSLPKSEPLSVKLVGAHTLHTADEVKSDLTYEHQYASGYFLIDVLIGRKDGPPTILGMHVKPINDSLENINKFTFSGRAVNAYITLLAGLLAFGTTMWASFVWFRSRPRKKRWLLFILLGFGTLTVNWTTGESYINPLSGSFFSFGAQAVPYGPWMISCSLPIGAVWFLSRPRKKAEEVGGPIGGS